jgi:F-type H+-transporting ATPase subunit alpha
LQQPPYDPLPVAQQIIVLLAVTQGLFEAIQVERLAIVEKEVRHLVCDRLPVLCRNIAVGKDLSDADRTALMQQIQTILPPLTVNFHGNH